MVPLAYQHYLNSEHPAEWYSGLNVQHGAMVYQHFMDNTIILLDSTLVCIEQYGPLVCQYYLDY